MLKRGAARNIHALKEIPRSRISEKYAIKTEAVYMAAFICTPLLGTQSDISRRIGPDTFLRAKLSAAGSSETCGHPMITTKIPSAYSFEQPL
jgi:hypothetical protein